MVTLLLSSSALTGFPSSGIGIGIVIGDPTGLSLKFWGISQNSAFQFNVGGGGFVSPADLALSSSLLFHIILTRETPIIGYLGVGALVGINQGKREDNVVFGILIPLGLEFIFREIPLDLFVEVPPVVAIESGGDVKAGLTLGIGLRFIIR